MTLLAWAARWGHADLARVLLSRGASVQSGDWKSRTPLHRACSGCNADVVKVLLDHGADPNARDQTWRTPLHRAARWGSPECSTLLLDAGADIEARDKELARTPLHFASRSGGLETTLVLLNNGAALNAKTVAGNTPLHLACDRGLIGNVKMLKEWGAEANSKNEAGATPSEVAAPWVEDSVKASMQEILAAPGVQSKSEGGDAESAQSRPQPAMVRPRPRGAAEKEAGLMDSIRSQRISMAECPDCQQDALHQIYTLKGDGATGQGVTTGLPSAHRSPSTTSSGKVKVCSVHRSRAQPGEAGLPGFEDDREPGSLGGDVTGSFEERGAEFRSRRGMGKSRKKQLSSKSKYEGGHSHGGCCIVQ
ncbi:unnamed protein product [Pylaiella littoralis]